MANEFSNQADQLWEHLQDAQACARQLRNNDRFNTQSIQTLCNIIDLCEVSKIMRDQVLLQAKGVRK